MHWATVSEVVMAVIVVMGAITATIAWFFRRGKQEGNLASSVEKHAEATTELAAQVGGLRDTLQAHGETLTEHHWRLKALEERKVEVRVS